MHYLNTIYYIKYSKIKIIITTVFSALNILTIYLILTLHITYVL